MIIKSYRRFFCSFPVHAPNNADPIVLRKYFSLFKEVDLAQTSLAFWLILVLFPSLETPGSSECSVQQQSSHQEVDVLARAVPVFSGFSSSYLCTCLQFLLRIQPVISWLLPVSYLSRSFFGLYSWRTLQNKVTKKDVIWNLTEFRICKHVFSECLQVLCQVCPW